MPRSLRNTAPRACKLQADGITPVTRLLLLASSFRERLQGDFRRRACPPFTKRRLSSQTFGRVLFLFLANYSITGLSYHIFAVCQPIYAGKMAELGDGGFPYHTKITVPRKRDFTTAGNVAIIQKLFGVKSGQPGHIRAAEPFQVHHPGS